MDKFPLVVKKEYTMYLEFFDHVYWFHVDAHEWSPKVKRMMLKDLRKIQDLVTIPLRALVGSENLKLQKFGDCLGWVVELETTLKDGSKALIYKWS